MKIAVVGLGGIGSVIGGFLAHGKTQEDEVYFLEPWAVQLEAVRKHGLTVVSDHYGTFCVQPDGIFASAAELHQIMDVVILCVKSYSLADAVPSLAPICGENTVLIPILNGIGIREKIEKVWQRGILTSGCTYITGVSNGHGEASHPGISKKVLFGSNQKEHQQRLREIEQKLQNMGVDFELSSQVEVSIWSKYFMVCAFGVCTVGLQANVGQILSDEKMFATLYQLLEEIYQVGIASGIALPPDQVDRVIEDARKLDPSNTSSLRRDLDAGKKCTEFPLFSPYVSELGKKLGIPTPGHDAMIQRIENLYGLN
ncbi:MAG: ketopantoate reductase family protein [Eubacteriales bacterium]|jgi:2-dehydropantoate 2-reductase